MKSKISMTNESFTFLKGSSEFLNIVLDNVKTCVLILDNQMRLQAFNNPFKTIFSNHKDEDLMYMRCGEALGCAYQVEENTQCGKTSKCKFCELRTSAMESYLNNKVIYNEEIKRPFFNKNNEKVYKDLNFSTRLFTFNKEKYIILLIEDVTRFIELRNKVSCN